MWCIYSGACAQRSCTKSAISGSDSVCATDPGFDVDLWITTDLRTMTAIWLGLIPVGDAGSRLRIDGDPALARTITKWMGLSTFAGQRKLIG